MLGPEDEVCVELARDGFSVAADVELRLDDVDEGMFGYHRVEKTRVRFEVHQWSDSNADADVATIELKIMRADGLLFQS